MNDKYRALARPIVDEDATSLSRHYAAMPLENTSALRSLPWAWNGEEPKWQYSLSWVQPLSPDWLDRQAQQYSLEIAKAQLEVCWISDIIKERGSISGN